MRHFRSLAGVGFVLAWACGGGGIDPDVRDFFQPLPESMDSESNPASEAKVQLGRLLFHDPRLSKDGKIACSTCHPLDRYGVDGKPVSEGHEGRKGTRNSPTVFMAAGHMAQFWDGRVATVEEQARGPMLNPSEMGMDSGAEVARRLAAVADYRRRFALSFPAHREPLNFDNAAKAIAAFERKLLTPGRWDRYLRGDARALLPEERSGLRLFIDTGCVNCHNGPLVGGTIYQKLGAIHPWPNTTDLGRYEITRQEQDRMVFKVPSLRNVARTAPYLHDGSVPTLEEAVRVMGEFQLDKRLTDQQVRQIKAWLNVLTGDLPAELVQVPVLPR